MKKHLRPYIQFMTSVGIESDGPTATGGTHFKVIGRYHGKTRFFIIPASPSDNWRGFENWKSDVRRWARTIDTEKDALGAGCDLCNEPRSRSSQVPGQRGQGPLGVTHRGNYDQRK